MSSILLSLELKTTLSYIFKCKTVLSYLSLHVGMCCLIRSVAKNYHKHYFLCSGMGILTFNILLCYPTFSSYWCLLTLVYSGTSDSSVLHLLAQIWKEIAFHMAECVSLIEKKIIVTFSQQIICASSFKDVSHYIQALSNEFLLFFLACAYMVWVSVAIHSFLLCLWG